MTQKAQISMADQLYLSLPQVYRDRDQGDLKKYLTGFGKMLDRLHATLEQRLADSFPYNPEDDSPACQPWILPYFADLLDVRLISPHAKGRRDEISMAVQWRQTKGTLACLESITESLGQMEAEIQEGWQRVAITPLVNRSLVPARAFGYGPGLAMDIPGMAARHPSLPTSTVDTRFCSGAVRAKDKSPGSKITGFDNEKITWRQASPFGVPGHPGSFDDLSRRTPDLRDPGWNKGYFHPGRVLLHVPPPDGFYSPDTIRVQWRKRQEENSRFVKWIEEIPPDPEDPSQTRIFRNRTLDAGPFKPVRIWGRVETRGTGTWRFEGIQFDHALIAHHARLELEGCTLLRAESHVIDKGVPVILAKFCLIRHLRAARGRVDLEYATVLEPGIAQVLNISDTILLGKIEKDDTPATDGPEQGCFRYSRHHPDQDITALNLFSCTAEPVEMFNRAYGKHRGKSCGVLHPACPEPILFGAEDGGEMGAFHHHRYSLLFQAVEEKLKDFIPVGMAAVVIPDAHLQDRPRG